MQDGALGSTHGVQKRWPQEILHRPRRRSLRTAVHMWNSPLQSKPPAVLGTDSSMSWQHWRGQGTNHFQSIYHVAASKWPTRCSVSLFILSVAIEVDSNLLHQKTGSQRKLTAECSMPGSNSPIHEICSVSFPVPRPLWQACWLTRRPPPTPACAKPLTSSSLEGQEAHCKATSSIPGGEEEKHGPQAKVIMTVVMNLQYPD